MLPVEAVPGSLQVKAGEMVRLVFEVDPEQPRYQLRPRYSQGEAVLIYSEVKPLEINLSQGR